MKVLKSFIKAVVLVGLIFGVLYFGLTYYFNRQAQTTEASVDSAPSKNAEDLKLLHEELSILEQKIQELRREGKPYTEEEEAVEGVRSSITKLKKDMAAELPEETVVRNKKTISAITLPGEGLFADPYRVVVAIGVGVLIVILFVFFLIRAFRQRRRSNAAAKPVREKQSSVKPRLPEVVPERTLDSNPQLKDTLERFKSASAVIQQGETREVPVAQFKRTSLDIPVIIPAASELGPVSPEKPAPIVTEKKIVSQTPDTKDNSLIEQVFALSQEGVPLDEISEKLHIDRDQVRLILRFKR